MEKFRLESREKYNDNIRIYNAKNRMKIRKYNIKKKSERKIANSKLINEIKT